MREWSRFDKFLNLLCNDVYPEPAMEPHISITKTMISALVEQGLISAGSRILDIGCGQGGAMEQFERLGAEVTGITLGPDIDICRGKGLNVKQMDQNFMQFNDAEFDLLWCRHVLEHSIAPFFTLSEYRRVTKADARVYIEVPAPDTSAHHETNPNHYSVLPRSAWLSLFGRTRFTVERSIEFTFNVPCGPDIYWGFLLRNAAPD